MDTTERLPENESEQLAYLRQRFRQVRRLIPCHEGTWQRAGHLVRLKLIDLEAGLPPGVELHELRRLAVVHRGAKGWERLPHHLDFADGFGRWTAPGELTPNTQLCFSAPAVPAPPEKRAWSGARGFTGFVEFALWDSRQRAWCPDLRVYYSGAAGTTVRPERPRLRFVSEASGVAVCQADERLLHFAADRGWQLDYAAVPGRGVNLIEPGRTWRWALTETPAELTTPTGAVTFMPQVTAGEVLVATVSADVPAGTLTATLRILLQSGALILEFSDYRTLRRRPELPPEQHPRDYAGQPASPYPGVHYAAFAVDAPAAHARIFDHLFHYGEVTAGGPPALVYQGARSHRGYNWMTLALADGVVGITAHGRSHHPDHPFKAGTVDGRLVLMLEPFGSVVDDHYHASDRHLLVLAPSVDAVRETFDTLDTFPLLSRVTVRRHLAFLDTYDCLRRWVNLNLDYLMRPGRYRNALLTDGSFRNDEDTCLVPFGELARLYEKTGWAPLGTAAETAAAHVAEWILGGRFNTRGRGLHPNGGGIYQNEQIYLLLALAEVYRVTHQPRLKEALDYGVQWLYDHRGGEGTWGWSKYQWHAGGWAADGHALYYWPVNTNQFATLNFRLYQLTGDRAYYDRAMEVMQDYLTRIPADSREVIRGGGVSDTTRGVHLFAEALEVAGADARIDVPFWRRLIDDTLARFWVEGWVQIRHSTYGEVILPGTDPQELFSPGFHHWHNVGSFLDLGPRIHIAAEVGVGEQLTRWAVRDLAHDFDQRFGLEEHVHFAQYTIRDTDLEPASWLDAELLPMAWAVQRRGWIDAADLAALRYRIHRLIQRTFIPLDAEHGGWAAAYDAHDGEPIKYLAYWEHRHSFERFAPGEPQELWGLASREAFYDHSTHFWSPLGQLVDELLVVESLPVADGVQPVRCWEDGLAAGLPGPKPGLAVKAPGATQLALAAPWQLCECRTVRIGAQEFWLFAAEQA